MCSIEKKGRRLPQYQDTEEVVSRILQALFTDFEENPHVSSTQFFRSRASIWRMKCLCRFCQRPHYERGEKRPPPSLSSKDISSPPRKIPGSNS